MKSMSLNEALCCAKYVMASVNNSTVPAHLHTVLCHHLFQFLLSILIPMNRGPQS